MGHFVAPLIPILALWNNFRAPMMSPGINQSVTAVAVPHSRIVGGVVANDLKFVVNYFVEIGGNTALCGGTIISESAILTAAHCFDGIREPVKATQIYIGGKKLKQGMAHKPKKVYIHRNYKEEHFDYDVALIVLDQKITFDGNAQKIDIASELPSAGTTVWAAGFGDVNKHYAEEEMRTLDGTVNEETILQKHPKTIRFGTLNKVKLKLISNANCARMLKGEISKPSDLNTNICAYERNKDACIGDSGGPLFTNDKKYVIGIVSWGLGCADVRFPGIYTNVPKFASWIQKAHRRGKTKKTTNRATRLR